MTTGGLGGRWKRTASGGWMERGRKGGREEVMKRATGACKRKRWRKGELRRSTDVFSALLTMSLYYTVASRRSGISACCSRPKTQRARHAATATISLNYHADASCEYSSSVSELQQQASANTPTQSEMRLSDMTRIACTSLHQMKSLSLHVEGIATCLSSSLRGERRDVLAPVYQSWAWMCVSVWNAHTHIPHWGVQVLTSCRADITPVRGKR